MVKKRIKEEKFQTSVRFPKDVYDTIAEIARVERLPFNTVVIRLLRDRLEELGKPLTPQEIEVTNKTREEFLTAEYIRFMEGLVEKVIEDRERKRSSKQ